MTVAIEFEQVSKRFTLHHERKQPLGQRLLSLVRANGDGSTEDFWSLKDLSFQVARGTTLGIIGHNGAGKSTCLKLIARILEPTSGRVTVNGRVSALLELGAGFHPDLTGRENVFLNGAVLGIRRAEMQARFDDIVSFAELERFIDMPIKHYSSGMFMRLGFAVATSIQPDILITDEVLAVGDLAFQRRCFERLRRLRSEGATVIVVSHDLRVIRTSCEQAIWLDQGQMRRLGPSAEVVDAYEDEVHRGFRGTQADEPEPAHGNRWGSREAEITKVEFLPPENSSGSQFFLGEPYRVRIHYLAHQRIDNPMFGVAIHREDGLHVNGPNTVTNDFRIPWIEGRGWVDYIVDQFPLQTGYYYFTAAIYDHTGTYPYDHHDKMYPFEVQRAGRVKEHYGSFYIPGRWDHERVA
jgi:lipopolysaccharide transport system ATP-binding protein